MSFSIKGLQSDSFNFDIRTGRVSNISGGTVLGTNPNASTSDKDLISLDGSPWYRPVADETLTISSTSADDAAGGTGARLVAIVGLDDNLNVLPPVILALDGTTPVTVSPDMFRVNSFAIPFIVGATGSTGSNVGDLYIGSGTVTAGMPDNIIASMPKTVGISTTATFTVPVGKRLFIEKIQLSVSKDKAMDFGFRSHLNGVSRLSAEIFGTFGTPAFNIDLTGGGETGTDIELLCKGTVANTAISVLMEFYLVDNSLVEAI